MELRKFKLGIQKYDDQVGSKNLTFTLTKVFKDFEIFSRF